MRHYLARELEHGRAKRNKGQKLDVWVAGLVEVRHQQTVQIRGILVPPFNEGSHIHIFRTGRPHGAHQVRLQLRRGLADPGGGALAELQHESKEDPVSVRGVFGIT